MKQLCLFFVVIQFGLTGFSQTDDSKSPSPPQAITLSTKDNVQLHLQYFPGRNGKETIPVILIHGAEGTIGVGSGQDFKQLATMLQANGHAVFVPDLRGFGESKQRVNRGSADTLDRSRFNRKDIANMVRYDLETVKRYVVNQHNAGELNVEHLCVVGFEMGAVVAINWARLDWNAQSFPQLKQGQDVKTMILVSPTQSHLGFSISEAIADKKIQSSIATMIAVGARSHKAATQAGRIFKRLERAHRYAGEGQTSYETLAYREFPTSLQGTKLLNAKPFALDQAISKFITRQSDRNADLFPWKSRKRR